MPTIPWGSVTEICYVTTDLTRAIERWAQDLGAGPFFTLTIPADFGTRTYRGRPAQDSFSAALGFCGSTLVEFVQPLNDRPSVFREVLDERGDLAAHHSVHGPRGHGNFRQHCDTAFRSHGCSADGLEGQRQKRVARKNGYGFAELLVARRLAAAKVVIVEGRQVVMDERIGVDEFDRTGRIVRRRDVAAENPRRLNAKNGTDPLAACKDAIPHRRVNGRRRRRLRGQQPLEGSVHGKTVFFEKGRIAGEGPTARIIEQFRWNQEEYRKLQ